MSNKTVSLTTRSIRKMLVKGLERVGTGDLAPEDGRSMIGLANQISQNMSVEVRVMSLKSKLGHANKKFGDLEVG